MKRTEVQEWTRVVPKEEDLVSDEPRSLDNIHKINVDDATKESDELNSSAEADHLSKKRSTELYQATLKGDWKTAKSIIDIDSSTLTMKLNDEGDTALHIAAAKKHVSFVHHLVQLMSSSDLTLKNEKGNTALTSASMSGVVKIAKLMVDKNPTLPILGDPQNPQNPIPIFVAIAYKRRDMTSFLFSKTNFEALDAFQQLELFIATISVDYYDIALDILKRKPKLALERREENGDTALHVLARKPCGTIGSSSELSDRKKYLKFCNALKFIGFKGIYNKFFMQTLARQVVELVWNIIAETLIIGDLRKLIDTPSRLLHDAASVGNVELLIVIIRSYPDVMGVVDDNNKTIFHVAVENRREDVFTLIYEIGNILDITKDVIRKWDDIVNCYDKNILHSAAKLAAPSQLSRVSGAVLQFQRELFWFKVVEKTIWLSRHRIALELELSQVGNQIEIVRDLSNLPPPPHFVFDQEHKQLLKEGKEQVKNTAKTCMPVAALIASVVLTASFLMPKGNDRDTNIAIFWQKHAFTVFIILDIAALLSSTTSMLAFLPIFTFPYVENDFLVRLPTQLLVALTMLLVSGVCMVLAFSVTFFTAYHKAKAKFLLALGAVSIIPFFYVCVLHSRLVVDILRNAYWYKFSLKRCKRWLFIRKRCKRG